MTQTSSSSQLNQHCACKTLDRSRLSNALREQLDDAGGELLVNPIWSQLFSDSAVFVPKEDIAHMQGVVKAIENAAELPGYQHAVLAWAPSSAHKNPGPAGMFMGYDFHLSNTGPRLIEVNSNAGGAFLNAVLARAQQRCCSGSADAAQVMAFEDTVIAMFESEWRAQGRTGRPSVVAIIDDRPAEQYLYPEFRLAQTLLRKHGLETIICGPDALSYTNDESGGRLIADERVVDMVYNRLVDFGLEQPEHSVIRQAWLEGAAVITPNPFTHALFADKRNLAVLSDDVHLQQWGLSQIDLEYLKSAIPLTRRVTREDADMLWQGRRELFFKPVASHGSKGVYRGSKLTKRTFNEILHSEYIAQQYVPPSERLVVVDGERHLLKVDVRLYTYKGEVLITAARLYRGQATNFRTPGGGFAPVFPLPSGL